MLQGVPSKLAGYEQILRTSAIEDAAVAYMGDDLLDLPVIARVGLSGPRPMPPPKCGIVSIGSAVMTAGAERFASSSSWCCARKAAGRRSRAIILKELMEGTGLLLAALIALLVGLATGKAWERYSSRTGDGSIGGAPASRRTTCSA